MDPIKYLRIEDVARQYKISDSTVRRLIREGLLPGRKVGGQWRFDPSQTRKAFDRGEIVRSKFDVENETVPSWEAVLSSRQGEILSIWRQALRSYVRAVAPTQIVVVDRRGSKLWKLMGMEQFQSGIDLWHSSFINWGTNEELSKQFSGERVLLFDDMMQHGKFIRELRERIEHVARPISVDEFVCARRRSMFERGEIKEHRVYCAEDLDDNAFAERAAMISRLIDAAPPPFNTDHVLFKCRLTDEKIDSYDLVTKLCKWGNAFVVRDEIQRNGSRQLAVTLDRPQFFRPATNNLGPGFSFDWKAPCKVRLYYNENARTCSCAFIAYPTVDGGTRSWRHLISNVVKHSSLQSEPAAKGDGQQSNVEQSRHIERAYVHVCLQLAVQMLRHFVESGAASDLGLRIGTIKDSVDQAELVAAFGSSVADDLTNQIAEILRAKPNIDLFGSDIVDPIPLFIRTTDTPLFMRGDLIDCRREVLQKIPSLHDDKLTDAVVTLGELVDTLSDYLEPTIGRVIDYEFDWGTVKSSNHVSTYVLDGEERISVMRGLKRGELGPWFDEHESVVGDKDRLRRLSVWIAPHIVDLYCRRMNQTSIGRVHLNKIFANLSIDWPDQMDKLCYSVWPYKFGAVPYIRLVDGTQKKLIWQHMLEEHSVSEGPKGTMIPSTDPIFRDRYRKVPGEVKTQVAGLMNLYVAIQKECKTIRPSRSKSGQLSILGDPLVVLASVRREKEAYCCGWFELRDWLSKGQRAILELSSLAESGQPQTPVLEQIMHDFAEPAAFLYDKLEMYRYLPHLRQQIIDKFGDRDEFSSYYQVIEKIDVVPSFSRESNYPVGNLEWALTIMRPFTSFVRQISTTCKLDRDNRQKKRTDDGRLKDATYYLDILMTACETLQPLESDLRQCIQDSAGGLLKERTAATIDQSMKEIQSLFAAADVFPDPRPIEEQEEARARHHLDLIATLRMIRLPSPYAVAVADMDKVRKLALDQASQAEPFGDAFESIRREAEAIVKRLLVPFGNKIDFRGSPADNLVLASRNPEELVKVIVQIFEEFQRTKFQFDGTPVDTLIKLPKLSFGLAWHDSSKDSRSDVVNIGTIAYRLTSSPDKKPRVAITPELRGQLSTELQSQFEVSLLEEPPYLGKVFVRKSANKAKAAG